jgi:hypothetical protein
MDLIVALFALVQPSRATQSPSSLPCTWNSSQEECARNSLSRPCRGIDCLTFQTSIRACLKLTLLLDLSAREIGPERQVCVAVDPTVDNDARASPLCWPGRLP